MRIRARGRAWCAGLGLAVGPVACGDDGGTPPADTDGSSTGDSPTGGPASGSGEAASEGDTTGDSSATASGTTAGSEDTGPASDTTGGPTIVVDDPIRVAYLADDATIGTDELWLFDEADADAGALRLSHTLPARAFISPFFPVSSDGRWLVYRMIQPGPGSEHELWATDVSVPAPEAPFRVDDSGALIDEYAILPDASAVAWITVSGVHTASLTELSPGSIVTHTPAPTGGGSYGLFDLGADSNTIAYTADPEGSGVGNAFVLSLDTDAIIELSDLTVPGTSVDGNSLELLAGALLYEADRDVAEPEMFWASLLGGAPVKVNDPLTDESLRTERLAPSESAIAYWVGYPGTPDDGTVFVAALDAAGPSAPIDVHAGQPGVPQQGKIVWATDASALLYSVQFVDRLESWVVPVADGVPGTPVRITGDVLADGEHLVAHAFDPAGDVFYVAGTSAGDELFFVDRSSGTPTAPVKVSPTPVGTGLSGDIRVSSDGAHVAFTGFVDSSVIRDLYVVDRTAAPPWPVDRIDTDLPAGGEVTPGPTFSPDGAHLLYTANSPDLMQRDLFDVPPGGTGFDVVLSISAGGYVTAFVVLP